MLKLEILLCILNVIIPSLYGWTSSATSNEDIGSPAFYYLCSFLNLLLTTASLVFLGVALYKIRMIMASKEELAINTKAMCLHLCIFTFYILVITTFFISDLFKPPSKRNDEARMLTQIMRILTIFLL
jgi:hypothetical protein